MMHLMMFVRYQKTGKDRDGNTMSEINIIVINIIIIGSKYII